MASLDMLCLVFSQEIILNKIFKISIDIVEKSIKCEMLCEFIGWLFGLPRYKT